MTRTNILVLLLLQLAAPALSLAQSVSGIIQDPMNDPLAGVRVTLYNSDTSFFAEDRSTALGAFNFKARIPSPWMCAISLRDRTSSYCAL